MVSLPFLMLRPTHRCIRIGHRGALLDDLLRSAGDYLKGIRDLLCHAVRLTRAIYWAASARCIGTISFFSARPVAYAAQA
jgi:hypothetical protein